MFKNIEGIPFIMINNKNCILIISHSNYLIKSGGVEKFLRDYCKILEKNDCHFIHAFPVIEMNKKLKLINREYIALSFDGTFEGIWRESDLAEAVDYIAHCKFCKIKNIQIHHLHGWNLYCLETIMNKWKLPIYLFIHDLQMICPSMFRESANKQCMQFVPIAGEALCGNCRYRDYDVERFTEIKYFLKQIHSKIECVYAPSNNTKNHFIRAFPQFENITEIREHLVFNLRHKALVFNKDIRIAYLGSTGEHKGYQEWKKLLESVNGKGYKFYYFGTEYIDDPRVKCVNVDARKPVLKSMVEQLVTYNIDIAFLWSKCQETFCYTYYEASEAGAYILTNNRSGNICEQVIKHKNGKVFKSITQCITFLDDIHKVAEVLKKFGDTNLLPINVRTNDEMREAFCKEDTSKKSIEKNQIVKKLSKPHKKFLFSLLYKKLRM